MNRLVLLCIILFSQNLLAVTIEFPKEELARESVLPVFNNAAAVKSRLVPTEGRFEFGLASGLALNEPFFKTQRFGGHIGYHFTEAHGFVLAGQIYQSGLGNNGEGLASTDLAPNSSTDVFIRMQQAPQPKYHLIANYQITPYYGKISVFKDFVMNLSLYGLLGVGAVDVGGEIAPALNVGLGQKFYFNGSWGIRADLGLMAYEGVNYFAAKDGSSSPLQDSSDTSGDDVLSEVPVSEFDRQMNYDLHLSVALIILL